MTDETRPPLPPFTEEAARQKVRMAENAWNKCDPEGVAMAYTTDSQWRNRSQFISGRAEIARFLADNWRKEQGYRLTKELWAHGGARIAVRFAYEYHDEKGQWFRAYGNENWEFSNAGLMQRRIASINDLAIAKGDRKLTFAQGPRPDNFPGLTELGL